jgi:hypothetical protein
MDPSEIYILFLLHALLFSWFFRRKRFGKVVLIVCVLLGLFHAYGISFSWRVDWNTHTGKQRYATCVFGFPVWFHKTIDTELSKRLMIEDSEKGEWVTVASEKAYETAFSSWCFHSGFHQAIRMADIAVNGARSSSDNLDGHEMDSQRIAMQFIVEFGESRDVCATISKLRTFSEKLQNRDFEIFPFRNEELDQIFADENLIKQPQEITPEGKTLLEARQ